MVRHWNINGKPLLLGIPPYRVAIITPLKSNAGSSTHICRLRDLRSKWTNHDGRRYRHTYKTVLQIGITNYWELGRLDVDNHINNNKSFLRASKADREIYKGSPIHYSQCHLAPNHWQLDCSFACLFGLTEKRNIKACVTSPLRRESSSDRWFPLKGQ